MTATAATATTATSTSGFFATFVVTLDESMVATDVMRAQVALALAENATAADGLRVVNISVDLSEAATFTDIVSTITDVLLSECRTTRVKYQNRTVLVQCRRLK